ncbi:cell growth-regulating nucleolar protein isoform X1 [Latimeria chalumnae]|uniref:Cell growth-regulating nucleolar protein n=1 Tax=Latimeria chalumnae TaxID=7897 RepID=M3XHM0_LATCH|nr:PREDICTED: cell growth-regulating nucleolar protein isoform X3 [Latimeria chalumnae]XP_006008988.1 PREDICTED: cell growth-regulating nucleolar protein isoform X3 [Latimeria chalumnae]XP_014351863.1 PREDICTED: cell growth-regulating nucleolar protein isoform X3 [Latimeria chalumnae]|eukprot:XP_006008987.1 PREDICTED: cell growth-regulating nucleolar protein isoform X3 [Latimeria chalumnae]
MVFFTCNACGESVKKGQVEKHLNICRSCECLSCIDCGKDFWGDDYKNHLKCISEDQKYGGKDYEAKANKGEIKQQQWIQKIHEAMNKPNIDPKVCVILKQISSYENVPRKKAKFQNWMKNSLKIHGTSLQDQVWDIFSAATNKGPDDQQQGKLQSAGNAPNSEEKEEPRPTQCELTIKKKKKSKRERKEERKKSKKEKKELVLVSKQENSGRIKGEKCKMKNGEAEGEHVQQEVEGSGDNDDTEWRRKKQQQQQHRQDCIEEEEEVKVNGHQLGTHTEVEGPESLQKKNLKRKGGSNKVLSYEPQSKLKKVEGDEIEAEENKEVESVKKGKFNWKETIKAVLQKAPDNEISVKKLRKKVLSQYYIVTGDENYRRKEDLMAIFNKKINNNPKFRVLKEKVKLVR